MKTKEPMPLCVLSHHRSERVPLKLCSIQAMQPYEGTLKLTNIVKSLAQFLALPSPYDTYCLILILTFDYLYLICSYILEIFSVAIC